MLDGLSSALTAIRQAGPKIFFGLALASGLLLFSPSSSLVRLGLETFVQENRAAIGIVFLVSLVLIITEVSWWAGGLLRKIWSGRRRDKARISTLYELTPDEKAYLAPYVFENVNTQYFEIDDGIAAGLTAKTILYQASSIGSMVDGFAFNLQPWARKRLVENPHLLDGAAPAPRSPRERMGLDW